jgi:hypothetical protein
MNFISLIYKQLPDTQKEIYVRKNIGERDYCVKHGGRIMIRQKTKDKRQKTKDKRQKKKYKSKRKKRRSFNFDPGKSKRLSHQKTYDFSLKF